MMYNYVVFGGNKIMKKNIFKILGLGALVCFGGFTLVGCSALDNKDEITKLTETIEILEGNNKLLEETNEILNQELSKLSNKDAVRILKETGSKYLFNEDNILNNIKISLLNDKQETGDYEMYYKDDTNGPIYYSYQNLLSYNPPKNRHIIT